MTLVETLHPTMVRAARMYVSSQAVAEEVAQEAWLGVLEGIDRFEGRSSLRTWILRIVSNIAKTRGGSESRSVPFAALTGDDLDAPTFSRPLPRSRRGVGGSLGERAVELARSAGLPRCRDDGRPLGDRRAPTDAGRGDGSGTSWGGRRRGQRSCRDARPEGHPPRRSTLIAPMTCRGVEVIDLEDSMALTSEPISTSATHLVDRATIVRLRTT